MRNGEGQEEVVKSAFCLQDVPALGLGSQEVQVGIPSEGLSFQRGGVT